MTRRPRDPFASLRPRGRRHPCAQCGYDHEYEFSQAQAWHEQHDDSIGESRDADTLQRIRRI